MIEDKGDVFGINDTDRLDFLQESTKGYGKGWILRLSRTRGMRLHETSQPGASPNVRLAIDNEIREKARIRYDEKGVGLGDGNDNKAD